MSDLTQQMTGRTGKKIKLPICGLGFFLLLNIFCVIRLPFPHPKFLYFHTQISTVIEWSR